MTRPASLKTRLVQLEVRPGRPSENTAAILAHIGAARAEGIELIAFPEMAVPGYLLGDEWEFHAFLRECEACGQAIAEAAHDIIVIFGNVAIDWDQRNEDGRVRKFNSLFLAAEGAFIAPEGSDYPFAVKSLMPNYRQFDDSRHFFDLRKLAAEKGCDASALTSPIRVNGISFGCLLCEDAWDQDYTFSPLATLAAKGVDIFVNISASPFTVNKNHKRNRVFSDQAARYGRPLLYVNNTGIQNNGKTLFTFDGASCAYDGEGARRSCAKAFAEDTLTLDLPLTPGATFGTERELCEDGIERIHQALRYGAKRFMHQCGISKVVIGVSGGIDSAVAAALYGHLLPPENLLLINMPSRYNSDTTRSLARSLASELNCLYADVPIQESVDLTRRQLHDLEMRSPDGKVSHLLSLSPQVMENVQARDRSARVLAAAAAAFGGVFTCNANKAEVTVGYTTLYGDLGGFLALLADLWKGEVYALAHHLNESVFGRQIIPEGSIDIVPSAELSSDHAVDEGKGDPLVYAYHDNLFRSWVEWWDRAHPEDILAWYQDGSLAERLDFKGDISHLFPTAAAFITDLERWWSLYQGMGVAKRIQAPPILAVKRRAFGFDHRESQMGPRFTSQYLRLKNVVLGR